MSVISSIIENINDTLAGSVFSADVFEGSVLCGIAYPYPEQKGEDTLVKIIPALTSETGESAELVEFTNTQPITAYHRIQDISYQYIQERSVGDDYTQRQTITAYMVVCGWRPSLRMSPDDLCDQIVKSFSTNPIVVIPGVKKAYVWPSGADLDFVRVFRQEFDKINYFLKPEQILLQIKYKVQADIKTSCPK